MAAHLPGAPDVAAFRANLRAGRCAMRRLTPDELAAAGEDPARAALPNYVPVAAELEGWRAFDAGFFGFGPKDAAILDPQHRRFLEVAWAALEDAGRPPESVPGPVGIWAGCGTNGYLWTHLASHPDLVEGTGMFLLRHTGNDKDFLATRVAHLFDLTGPAVGVQTACSTSLVAIHYAAQALLSGECDMALAGGVTIDLPQGRGHLFNENEILAPDGVCRAFDAGAAGTLFGSGAGVVVLRRLADALAAGDRIRAVIAGSAVTNDGAAKAGYLAPGVDGQARAIFEALAMAGAAPETIGHVEAHGTGTRLGDPIEVAALNTAFARAADTLSGGRRPAAGSIALGSVKPSIGHLDTAAGVAGLIKAVIALEDREIAPSLHYTAPNPEIDFAGGPFRVAERLAPFPAPPGGGPRRAGVTALGVGGTNAHVVLEEAPARPVAAPSDWPFQLLAVSGRDARARDAATDRLAAHLAAGPADDLADIAFTLIEGRRAFPARRVVVAETAAEAATHLAARTRGRVFDHDALPGTPEVVFLLPGGGAQYPAMARDLYETEPAFRDAMDEALALMRTIAGDDLRALWLPEPGGEADTAAALRRPSLQLPLILAVEVALARLWASWGVRPAALVGHSMGENAAACLAGVMSLGDALRLVHARGRLFDRLGGGGMLSVPLPEDEVAARLGPDLDLACVNAPGLCVVSGPRPALAEFARALEADGIEAQEVAIDVAAHSRALEPVLAEFRAVVAGLKLSPPALPVYSNRTGRPLTAAEATDPDYWVGHLRGTVRFAQALAAADAPNRVLLEVGPGQTLGALARACGVPAGRVVASLRHQGHAIADDLHFVTALGRLWACGVAVTLSPLWGEGRRRVGLPTYPFAPDEHFIAPAPATATAARAAAAAPPGRNPEAAQFFYRLDWPPEAAPGTPDLARGIPGPPLTWLVLADRGGIAAEIAARLAPAGHRVVRVVAATALGAPPLAEIAAAPGEAAAFALAPEHGAAGWEALWAALDARGLSPARIVHLWLADPLAPRPGSDAAERCDELGFYALLHLGQVLAGEAGDAPRQIVLATRGAVAAGGAAVTAPRQALAHGPALVLPREVPGVACRVLDLPAAATGRRAGAAVAELAGALLEEALAAPGSGLAAWRGGRRLGRVVARAAPPEAGAGLPRGAAVLITGGTGGIGLALARALVAGHGARVALVGRRAPEGEAAARLDRLAAEARAASGAALVLAGDVCNPVDMARVRAEAEAAFGPLHTLIHAAGVLDDAPMAGREDAAAAAVLAPKVQGTEVLARTFPDGALAEMVLVSSTSALIAPAGQADYVAANAYLAAYAASREGGRTRVRALAYGPWAEAGMAARALGPVAGDDTGPRRATGLARLTQAFAGAGGALLAEGTLKATDPWLDGHRLRAGPDAGAALLPGAAVPALVAEALAAHGLAPEGAFTLERLEFLRPLAVPDDAPRRVRVRLAAAGPDGARRAEVLAETAAGGFEATATLRVAPGAAAAPLLAPPAGLDTAPPGDLPQARHIAFGPGWPAPEAVLWQGGGRAVARLRLAGGGAGGGPGGSDGALPAPLPPGLLDAATGWAMALIPGYDPAAFWVPMGWRRAAVLAPLPACVIAHAALDPATAAADGGLAAFDITLTDRDGRVCLVAEGVTLRRIGSALALPAAAAAPTPPEGPGRARLARAVALGLTEAEGAAATLALLGATGGEALAIVSSLDLAAQIAEADAPPAAAASEGARFARPEAAGAYRAPAEGLEAELAALWSTLLGVERVGADDGFFDLGGHSLIAVRLFAGIRRRWGVDLALATLFEAPSLAALAARLAGAGARAEGAPAAAPAAAAAAPAAPARTHLVALNRAAGALAPGAGPGAGPAPLFVAAGMFGNVLNLRPLAQALGARPVFGLQARGLAPGEAPHASLPEAAQACIAEMAQVWPAGGPWLVAGYSGGGLTAWEIAAQLEAAGGAVPLVALFDTPLPRPEGLARRDRAAILWAEARAQGLGWPLRWLRARRDWARARRAAGAGPVMAAGAVADPRSAAVGAAFLAAAEAYAVPPRAGPVHLFRPPPPRRWQVSGGRWVSAERRYILPDNGWGAHAPALAVTEVPGDHDTMVLEPDVRVLAAALARALDIAETRPAGHREARAHAAE